MSAVPETAPRASCLLHAARGARKLECCICTIFDCLGPGILVTISVCMGRDTERERERDREREGEREKGTRVLPAGSMSLCGMAPIQTDEGVLFLVRTSLHSSAMSRVSSTTTCLMSAPTTTHSSQSSLCCSTSSQTSKSWCVLIRLPL